MQDHSYFFDTEATAEEIWAVFFSPKTKGQVIEHGDVRIEILHPGDGTGEGLVRHCHFRVPTYLLSGGRARSWEWLTEVKPEQSWRYDAVGKPLYSRASGWTRLEDRGEGWTRVHFRETYHVFNPILRFFLEKAVHAFISRDNDRMIKKSIEAGVRALREHRNRPAPAPNGD